MGFSQRRVGQYAAFALAMAAATGSLPAPREPKKPDAERMAAAEAKRARKAAKRLAAHPTTQEQE